MSKMMHTSLFKLPVPLFIVNEWKIELNYWIFASLAGGAPKN